MESKRRNILTQSSRVLLWSCATFIMLSGTVNSERQCYWCGPLAEQVHRSRRAPACNSPTEHVTVCEPGLVHCAIVASSPPFVESRFCVKLYQDECYPLFCNSTRTWKMTCPCRGDLCNGNNTEREKQAFAMLSKLVTKSQNVRIKKRAILSYNSTNQERTVIITNLTALEKNESKNNGIDDIYNNEQMIIVMQTAGVDLLKEKHNINDSNLSSHNLIQSTNNPATYPNPQDSSENLVNDITTQTETQDHRDNLVTKNPIKEMTSMKEIDTNVPSTTMAVKTEMKPKIDNTINLKPSEQLPTAEALQQNINPSVTSSKTTESIKADTTESSSGTEVMTTIESTQEDNYAGRLTKDTYTIIIGLFTTMYYNNVNNLNKNINLITCIHCIRLSSFLHNYILLILFKGRVPYY
ncbi:uncharacterized protein [Battus philenor]|uniref:uncharacterized protein n=1 Tax=Battus philenor TaxID=42288 RepID=UPI0035CEF2D1